MIKTNLIQFSAQKYIERPTHPVDSLVATLSERRGDQDSQAGQNTEYGPSDPHRGSGAFI